MSAATVSHPCHPWINAASVLLREFHTRLSLSVGHHTPKLVDGERVLVTGGAGFIASHAAEYYAERGVEVTILNNLSRTDTLDDADATRDTALYNWEFLGEQYPSVERIETDIRNLSKLKRIAEGHGAIVHTAGQVAVTTSLSDPVLGFETNARGALNVVESARRAESNPAAVFASTNKVYGHNVNEIPVREEDTRYWYDDPEYESGIPESFSIDDCEHTPYDVSKLAADLYMEDYAERGLVDAAAFRMSCIYGPRQFGSEDQGWVAHFALSALREESLTIFGDGKQVRDVLHVSDLIRAYDSFLQNPERKPSVYNLGGGAGHTTSLLEFLDILRDRTDTELQVTFDDWRESDQKVYVSDIGRVHDE